MSYRISGIDVHKKVLAVVVSDVEVDGEFRFERRMFGSNPEQLRTLAAWLVEQEAEEVVMESAGIDVHKKMLAVVVSNVEVESEFQFERRMFGSNPEQLRS